MDSFSSGTWLFAKNNHWLWQFWKKKLPELHNMSWKGTRESFGITTQQRSRWVQTTALPLTTGMVLVRSGHMTEPPFPLQTWYSCLADRWRSPNEEPGGWAWHRVGAQGVLVLFPTFPQAVPSPFPLKNVPLSPLRTQGDSSSRISLTSAAVVGCVSGTSWQVP